MCENFLNITATDRLGGGMLSLRSGYQGSCSKVINTEALKACRNKVMVYDLDLGKENSVRVLWLGKQKPLECNVLLENYFNHLNDLFLITESVL